MWLCGALFFVILVVSIIVGFNSLSKKNYTDDDGLKYAPTDTHVVPFSNAFCEELDLSSYEYDIITGYTAKLFMLSSSPKLTGHESFSFSKTVSKSSDELYYIYFYMYPGSKLTVSACSNVFIGPTFYLIKGNKNFKRWKNSPYSTENMGHIDVSYCGYRDANESYSYSIHSEDHYYMIFKFYLYTTVYMQMTFYRTRYEITDNKSVVDACNISIIRQYSSRCSVTVPLSGETAFLVVKPIDYQNFNWYDRVQLDVSCKPRVWVYVLISIACFISGIALMVAIGICLFVWKCKKKNHATISSESNSTTSITSSLELDSSPLISDPVPPLISDPVPPPINPPCNFEAPPMYTP